MKTKIEISAKDAVFILRRIPQKRGPGAKIWHKLYNVEGVREALVDDIVHRTMKKGGRS